MPQKRPAYLPGQYYHFYNREAHRVSIFKELDNYLFVLRKIKKYTIEFRLTMIAYCLMPNHYHFLIRQDGEQTAGLLPQRVKSSHLLQLCRYIHGNPVKDGLVADPADWPYSNYLEWIGQRDGKLYDPEFVQMNFSSAKDYRVFVLDDLRGRDLPDEIKEYLDDLFS